MTTNDTTPTVVISDFEFADVELERRIVTEAGLRFVAAQAKTPEEIVEACREADGIVNQYAQLSAEVIERLPRTRVISRYGIGVNTVDVDAATKAGILVANVPDGSLDDVAEHAAAMLLALARGLPRFGASMRAGNWSYEAAGPLSRLRGRVLGLVGFGQIPQNFARKLAGFDLEVIAHDPYASPEVAAAAGVRLVDLDELLAAADFVSVHAPLTPATEGMIGAEALAAMKSTAVLINTARGPVVDQEALVAALESGQVAGAGLDVFATEPLAGDHPLRAMDNVILTPHAAWFSTDSEVEIRSKAVRNVVEVLSGRPVPYPVNPDVVMR